MASVNKCFVMGRLGRDPEVRVTQAGKKIVSMSLATDRVTRSSEGENVKETEWHKIIVFGRAADIAEKCLKKGMTPHITGHLRTRKYTDKNNIERYATEIICDELTLNDNDRKKEEPKEQPKTDDVPF